ncbi:MAG: hypothetical protein J1F33_05335 [Clostridiales bacterium]|nr:hypothetical protein [Clostridiales bacterium]
MNAKQVKYYEIISEFFASDILKSAAVEKYFGAMLKHDYAMAEELWEFMLIRSDKDIKSTVITSLYVDKIYGMFYESNAAKTLKTLNDNTVIKRAVFQFSPLVSDGELFMLPINLLLSNKIDAVDDILKHVSKNEAMKVSFGAYMIKFLDKYFIEMMKKDAQRRVKLSSKLSSFLLSVVQKVKGDEKAMLVQRVKEVM